ncbi:MAG: M28 family peptidase [Bacteroidetes bacterium]|nr:M28 family peptidase [Bacteroidota bacterium]
MRRLPCSLAWSLMAGVLVAQPPPSVREQARGYVATLAGPAMHGRGYVSGGDSLAADWIAAQFDRLGLAPLDGQRYQRFHFPVNTFPDSVRVAIGGTVLQPGIDFITDPASGPAEGRFALVRPTFADLADPDARARLFARPPGWAAYLDRPATTDKDSLHAYAAFEAELVRHAPVLKQGGSKLTWSVANEALPHAVIELRAGAMPAGADSVELHVRDRFIPAHAARNVFGAARARKKGSTDWLVITAHYDHLGRMGPDALFPGANDNASGTAMLLCLAERIARHPLKKVNVLFIAFAGEEAGLQGSMWCAAHPPVDLRRIKLLINLDLNGTGDDGITVVNATEQRKAFDALVAINKRTRRLAQVKPRGPACNSDHCPFALKGVPAIFLYTMGGVSWYHDVNDRPETLPLTAFDGLYRTLIDLVDRY